MRTLDRRTFVKQALIVGAAASAAPAMRGAAEGAALDADTLDVRLRSRGLMARAWMAGLDPTGEYTLTVTVLHDGNVVDVTQAVVAGTRRVRVASGDARLVAKLRARTGSLRATYSLDVPPTAEPYFVELELTDAGGTIGVACAEVSATAPRSESPIAPPGGRGGGGACVLV